MSNSAKKCPPGKGRASPTLRCNLWDFPDKAINEPDFLHLLTVHLFDFADKELYSYAITISGYMKSFPRFS